MRTKSVHLEAFAHVLPERAVTSAAIEARLEKTYGRLGLTPGRIELMSGVRERRFFDPGTRPSAIAAAAGLRALESSRIDRAKIGTLVHASVCRDFLEPSTASVVHHALSLAPECTAFDLSNACLGFANAMLLVAGQIERGEIEAGLVVAGEDGGPLVEATIRALEENPNANRRDIKRAHASLTIGSGGAACVLAHESIARSSRRLLGGVALADTSQHELCRGDFDPAFGGPVMETDSEALMRAGIALAQRTFERFLETMQWTRDDVDRVVTHQVGMTHRREMLGALGLDLARDFPTVDRLGNIGSVSLPLTYALAVESGFIAKGQRVAALGIGSGLHCLMLAIEA